MASFALWHKVHEKKLLIMQKQRRRRHPTDSARSIRGVV
jgi:hypothetical protein